MAKLYILYQSSHYEHDQTVAGIYDNMFYALSRLIDLNNTLERMNDNEDVSLLVDEISAIGSILNNSYRKTVYSIHNNYIERHMANYDDIESHPSFVPFDLNCEIIANLIRNDDNTVSFDEFNSSLLYQNDESNGKPVHLYYVCKKFYSDDKRGYNECVESDLLGIYSDQNVAIEELRILYSKHNECENEWYYCVEELSSVLNIDRRYETDDRLCKTVYSICENKIQNLL